MNTLISNYITANKEKIFNAWFESLKENADERVINVVSDQVFRAAGFELIDVIIANMNNANLEYASKLSDFSEKTVRMGWPLSFVTKSINQFSKVLMSNMKDDGTVTSENQMEFVNELDRWMDPVMDEIINMYSSTWERTVSMQKIALQELSAPLIPVFEGITVMPLVGTIDTERAKQIMENLLQGTVKHRSEVVLIDITGVPVVDTMVAHHIIQAADAVRLVGAKCMLVGIRPEIAQTIVTLGIDLNQITTKNTLKKGIEAALELTNRKIVQAGGEV